MASREELEAKLLEAVDSGPSEPATARTGEGDPARRTGTDRRLAPGRDVTPPVIVRTPEARREAVQFFVRFACALLEAEPD